jgi:DinB superfamily
MLNFEAVNAAGAFADRQRKLIDTYGHLTRAELREATHASVNHLLGLIAGATDADITFVPHDPEAFDAHAAPEHQHDGWTAAHVIVHATASSEESAFLSAELARGVPNHGRSRYETPWESVLTVAHCRQRLEESRRIRLACLDVWPNLVSDVTQTLGEDGPALNATARFLMGLMHESSHYAQLAGCIAQAHAGRPA